MIVFSLAPPLLILISEQSLRCVDTTTCQWCSSMSYPATSLHQCFLCPILFSPFPSLYYPELPTCERVPGREEKRQSAPSRSFLTLRSALLLLPLPESSRRDFVCVFRRRTHNQRHFSRHRRIERATMNASCNTGSRV